MSYEQELINALRGIIVSTWYNGPNASNIICKHVYNDAVKLLEKIEQERVKNNG